MQEYSQAVQSLFEAAYWQSSQHWRWHAALAAAQQASKAEVSPSPGRDPSHVDLITSSEASEEHCKVEEAQFIKLIRPTGLSCVPTLQDFAAARAVVFSSYAHDLRRIWDAIYSSQRCWETPLATGLPTDIALLYVIMQAEWTMMSKGWLCAGNEGKADIPQAILRADANASELELQRLRENDADQIKAAVVASIGGIRARLDTAAAAQVPPR